MFTIQDKNFINEPVKRSRGEDKVYSLMREIYPKQLILRNIRPSWLKGLEIDIYVPRKKIAIEYQGEQHRKPVPDFGGKNTYISQKKNDQLKRKYCKENKVQLIEYWFDEVIHENNLRKKLGLKHVKMCPTCEVKLCQVGFCYYCSYETTYWRTYVSEKRYM